MFFTLRTKLIIIMSMVVTLATIGTSLVTQRMVRRMYQQRFEQEFKAEVRYFSEQQFGRLAELKRRCNKLGHSPEMANAIKAKDSASIRQQVIEATRDAYRTTQPNFLALPELRGPRGPQDRPDLPFTRPLPTARTDIERPSYGVVDAEGNSICYIDPDGRLQSADDARSIFTRRQPDKQKATLRYLAANVGDQQEICYSTTKGLDKKPHLRESIVTPIFAKDGKEVVGAVIATVLNSNMLERDLYSFSVQSDPTSTLKQMRAGTHANDDRGISSGFWIDGTLHSETIPDSFRSQIEIEVTNRIEAGKGETHFQEITVNFDIDGKSLPHSLLYRVLNPDSPFPTACHIAVYSLAHEQAQVRDLQSEILSIGMIALAVALGLILIISRNLTQPIRDIVLGTEQVRLGNFEVRVPNRRRDELGQLAASFNEMADGLQLKLKYQRLLSQIADPTVADQLMRNEVALGGELREVTILFCDIRGFTAMTGKMPPSEVIALLNEHMTALTALVHEHEGVVDKFVGDMIMALFGAPTARAGDAQHAADCALRMVQQRHAMNTDGRWQLGIGIGIATGQVVAGCMGSEERMDYTVLGERVNLAARLCAYAKSGEILVDEATHAKIVDIPTQSRPGIELKGYAEKVQAWALGDASDRVSPEMPR
jgi:class 3 adenylate cyclase